jgi:phospholipase C
MRLAFRPLPLVAATVFALCALATVADDSTDAWRDNDTWDFDSGHERIEWLRHHKGLQQIKTIVVIYAENRGFDNLYGLFPGANGIKKG